MRDIFLLVLVVGLAVYVFVILPSKSKGDEGDVGPKGDKGDTGPQGIKGDTGIKGDKGDVGPKGDKGDTGPIGPQGDKGDIGAKGDEGNVGPKGDKGDKGDTGEKGDRGAVGPQGPQGPTGNDGKDGVNGINGTNGTNGKDGKNGIDGIDGINGKDGEDGADGKDGEDGAQGPKGDPGAGSYESVYDFVLGKNGRGDTGASRALVKTSEQSLHVNYGPDFPRVAIHGNNELELNGKKIELNASDKPVVVSSKGMSNYGGFGPYLIKFPDSTKGTCLDLAWMNGSSYGGGTSCSTTDNDKLWMYDPVSGMVKNYGANKCLHDTGAKYSMETCDASEQRQKFKFDGNRLKGWRQNICLDMGHGNHAADCKDHADQRMFFQPAW